MRLFLWCAGVAAAELAGGCRLAAARAQQEIWVVQSKFQFPPGGAFKFLLSGRVTYFCIVWLRGGQEIGVLGNFLGFYFFSSD